MERLILKIRNNPLHISVGIIAIYALLVAEYIYYFNARINTQIFSDPTSTLYLKVFNNFTFFLVVIAVFIIWIMSGMLFHLFSTLTGGEAHYKDLLRTSAFCYIVPSICFLISLIIVINRISIPTDNMLEFFKTNKTVILVNTIINAGYVVYFITLIVVIKHLYKFTWIKSLGSIIIPLSSIYLLGQFFAKYVL